MMNNAKLKGIILAVSIALLPTEDIAAQTVAGNPIIAVDDGVTAIAADGACSLIEAFENAVDQAATHGDCAAGGSMPTTISLAADSEYVLTLAHNSAGGNGPNGLPIIGHDITVEGNGATIRRDGSSPLFRIFEVAAAGVLSLESVSVQGGSLGSPTQGGAGILSEGDLSLLSVSMSSHSGAGPGAAIHSSGDLSVTHSNLQGNGGGGPGGAILNAFGGVATIEYSTLSNNSCGGGGCALQNEGTAELRNATVSGNGGPNAGGIRNIGTITLTHVTFAQNGGATGGALTNNGSATLRNSLLADPGSPVACDGIPPVFEGANLIQDDSCGCSGASGCNAVAAGLGPLQDNGGATSTHALAEGSPAIDAAETSACLADDQRNVSRPQGVACDIGAFEWQPPPEPTTIPVAPATVAIAADGQCSLLEAFDNARNGQQTHGDCEPGSEVHTTIVLASGATYALTAPADNSNGPTALPVVDVAMAIDGLDAVIERGPAAPPMRLLLVDTAGELHLQNLTIRNGALSTPANAGSGILNEGDLSMSRVRLTGHGGPGSGGAISNSGQLAIDASRLDGNSVGGVGAAIHNVGGVVDVSGSTLSGNGCGGGGCGLQNEGTATLVNSTISGNGGPFAGGIHNIGTLTLRHATVAMNSGNNVEGNGLMNSGAATLENTLFFNPSAPLECSGAPPTFNGVNMIPDGSCGCSEPACVDGAWSLPGLADNGGPTHTHALEAGHVAIDAGAASVCPSNDQRGIERPQGDGCDVGAFESEFVANPQLEVSPSSVDFGQVMVGLASPPAVIAVNNAGNVELSGLSVGAAPSGFTIPSNSCGGTLAPGESCQVAVRFVPQAEQVVNETLAVSSTETTATDVSLQGTGIPFVDQIFGDRFNGDN